MAKAKKAVDFKKSMIFSRRRRRIDDAGDQEFRNWICLAGAMADRRAEIVDYIETYIFNSTKCFAVFPPNDAAAC